MNLRFLFLSAVFPLFAGGQAFATSPTAATSAATELVHNITHGQLHLTSTFKGPGPDIVGVIAQNAAGQKMLAWMIDGKYLAPGQLLDATGIDLSKKAAQAQGLVPKPMPPAALVQKAMHASGLTLGHAGPLVIAFEDPNCIWCHKMDEDAEPLIAAGKLRLRVIPVAFLKPTSQGRAVAILQAKSPTQAWDLDQSKFDVAAEEGGMPVAVDDQKTPAFQAVTSNTSLLAASGQLATPTLIVCEKGKISPEILHGIGSGQLATMARTANSIAPTGSCEHTQ